MRNLGRSLRPQVEGNETGRVGAWFSNNPDLGEILDRKDAGGSAPVLVSTHADALHRVKTRYGHIKSRGPSGVIPCIS